MYKKVCNGSNCLSDNFEGGSLRPALTAVGDFDLGPVAYVVEETDFRAFVQDEYRLAAFRR